MNVQQRRAIEALRAGVPNRDAVGFLPVEQPGILKRFDRGLQETEARKHYGSSGFIIGGEFGSGKSHVLQYLRKRALENNFGVSLVVVSKETPLSNLDLVYKAAIRELCLPDRPGGDLHEVALRLDPRAQSYADLFQWVDSGESRIDSIFAATLMLFARASANDELMEAIQSFWGGSRIKITDLRHELRNIGSNFSLEKRKLAELAPMRFRFAGALMQATGYRGWVLLLDEVELVASLAFKARAHSYANLSYLCGLSGNGIGGLYGISAATREFTSEIFTRKEDHLRMPAKLSSDGALLASVMAALDRIDENAGFWEAIEASGDRDLDRIYQRVSSLYQQAFDWEGRTRKRPPYDDVSRSMRMHMREWITRWDLERLDPTYIAEIEAEVLAPDLQEREGLEGFSEIDTDGETST